MAVRLVLHVLLCITLIVVTPIAQFGMTIKTILTLLFKVNNVFFMIKLKSAKNISGMKVCKFQTDSKTLNKLFQHKHTFFQCQATCSLCH